MNPEIFGRFLLLDKIASGGMAEVYLAKVPGIEGLEKFFALKRILPQHMVESEFVEMFKSEAKIALNLTQSNIAQIFEFGQENGQFFLLMEYIEGRDLRQILNRCSELRDGFTVEQSVYMISEVLKGLDYAHRCIEKRTGKPLRIIHRDMSPHNIMISYDGEVKIIDFGIAKAESRLTKTRAGTVKGKLSYMSPEHASGGEIDNRADLFSVGIVLWELLTGRRLFDADDDMVILQKIRECRVPDVRLFNPRYPEELQRIVAKALTKDPKYRYQAAAEFHRDLVAFLHRMNPNFTQYEMAAPVRRVFEKEIAEIAKKNLEYAKVTFENSTPGHVIQQPQAPVTPVQQVAPVVFPQSGSRSVSDTVDLSGQVTVTESVSRTNTDLMQAMAQQAMAEEANASQGTETFQFGDKTAAKTPVQPAAQSAQAAKPPPPKLVAREIVVQDPNAPVDNKASDFDVKKLISEIASPVPKVKHLVTQPDSTVTEDENVEIHDSGRKKDVMIMALCAAAFVIASLGIYFRGSLGNVSATLRQKAEESVAQVQEKFGMKRDPASVTLQEGEAGVNSSSRTAALQNAKISVKSNPANAEVLLNGHPHGSAPAELLLPLNTHVTITVKHEGYTSFTEEFTVKGPRDFDVVLQKLEQ